MSAGGGRALALDGWTLAMACEQFAEAGAPVDEARFRIAVTRVVRLRRWAEMPSGPSGGRGHALYEIGRLQRLHTWYLDGCRIAGTPALLAKELPARDPVNGDTRSPEVDKR